MCRKRNSGDRAVNLFGFAWRSLCSFHPAPRDEDPVRVDGGRDRGPARRGDCIMSTVHSEFATALEQVHVVPFAPSRSSTSLYRCLVVSASQTRREVLSEAAMDGGWDTAVFSDAEDALTEFRRTRFQLAFVDLDGFGAAPEEEFRDLCQQLAAVGSDLLLAVCGREGDGLQEIWARQLGVWLYLPGVIEGGGVAELCDEARGVVEQLKQAEERRAARV